MGSRTVRAARPLAAALVLLLAAAGCAAGGGAVADGHPSGGHASGGHRARSLASPRSSCAPGADSAARAPSAARSAAPPRGGAWTLSATLSGTGTPEFTAAVLTGPGSGWVFSASENGGHTAAWRLSGSRLRRADFPSGGKPVDVAAASSPRDVWAFAGGNRAARWNGCSWAAVTGFPGRNVTGAAVISSADVWVFGSRSDTSRTGQTAWHYDGSSWAAVPQAAGLAGASAVSGTDIWANGAFGTSSATVIAHWNGSAWQRTSVAALLPPPTTYCGRFAGPVYGVSATQAWAVGGDLCQDVPGPLVLLHFSGGRWHRVAKLGRHDPVGIVPDGRGGLWLPVDGVQVLAGAMLHEARGAVTTSRFPVKAGQLFLFGITATAGGKAALAVGRKVLRHGLASVAIVLRYRV